MTAIRSCRLFGRGGGVRWRPGLRFFGSKIFAHLLKNGSIEKLSGGLEEVVLLLRLAFTALQADGGTFARIAPCTQRSTSYDS